MNSVDIDDIRRLIGNVTGDSVNFSELSDKSPLLGAMSEFDSIAIMNLVVGLEQQYGIQIEFDELEESVFETVGSLCRFTNKKLKAISRD